jgi:hypothetical protein
MKGTPVEPMVYHRDRQAIRNFGPEHAENQQLSFEHNPVAFQPVDPILRLILSCKRRNFQSCALAVTRPLTKGRPLAPADVAQLPKLRAGSHTAPD